MAATVVLAESNGVSETVTDNISNINFGVVDEPNTDYQNHPIPIPGNSMEKYIRVHATGTFNKIDNIQIWKSAGTLLTGEDMQTNLKTSAYTPVTYAQPSTAPYTDQAMPTSDPGAANLGIDGSLTGALTEAGYSDYWKIQLKFASNREPGDSNTFTFTVQWDEQ